MDLGPAWVRRVREGLPEALRSRLAVIGELQWEEALALGFVLARHTPLKQDAASFVAWCASLSSGDLYELAAAWFMPAYPIPTNLGEQRDTLVDLLGGWNERYFARFSKSLLSELAASASALRPRLLAREPELLVEEVSNGIVMMPATEATTVLLIPQYHLRPWNLVSPYRGMTIISYPLETGPAAAGQPPTPLLRAARALGDANRLRLMRFLAEGRRSFTDIAGHLRLANSTVSYHLGLLRAAGLVRVFADVTGRVPSQYGLRRPALQAALDGLARYAQLDTPAADEANADDQQLTRGGTRA